MNDLERYRATMAYEPVDRYPWWASGPWPETLERWRTEGYVDGTDLNLGADRREFYSHWYFPCPRFENTVVEDDGVHVLYYNHEGILMRELKNNPYSSMPQFVKFPVETREEFRKFWAERMNPDPVSRLGADWEQMLRDIRSRPYPFILMADRWGGFFGPQRNLVGVEKLCMLFVEDPDFVEEMLDANADFLIALTGRILDVVEIDAFVFWEDMAYKTGPLISPAMARRYMLPRYRRVVDFLQSRGVKYIGLDSDGRVTELIPVWMDAGLNTLFPFEPQAGMDVNAVRREFGKDLRIWGGFDKRALAHGKEAIDAEIERIRPLIYDGGYIPHLDHSAPPDISWPMFQYYAEQMVRVCERG